jgi:regulator of sigma E protease
MELLYSAGSILIGTIVPFLFVLTVVIFVHEMGHYLVGRWCGIGAEAFSIGFGPELAGFTDRHGTRWKLSAIPLGGYVKFVGDVGVSSMPDTERLESLMAEQRNVAFHNQARWKKALTIFAGPAFNFLLAIAITAILLGIWGKRELTPFITGVVDGSPAKIAGFQPGDRIVSANGIAISGFDDLPAIIAPNVGVPVAFVVERNGQQLTLTATPELTERTDAFGNKVNMGTIGVQHDGVAAGSKIVELTPLQALQESVGETWKQGVLTVSMLKRLIAGREDRCQLGGPIKIAKMAGAAARQGFEWLVGLTAVLSLGIGIFNLFPLLPLDGGHLFVYGVDSVTRRPVPQWFIELLYRIGFVAVLALIGFVLWNDLVAC